MVVRTLYTIRDPFHLKEDEEDILEPETLNGVKDIFRYLKGMTDLGLFYTHESSKGAARFGTQVDSRLIGYVDAGYLSDPHRACSQMGYVFTFGNTVISWRSTKQMLVATSSNHAEILDLHEASR
ncbi:secreted RxLR effector protein 161-like [Pyrus communis]|uniref:secreted RxLR effector protein 161-like n=1 Tax=Pyrus communis TaxID=23211 RepID=UPI0035C21CA2